ncbi:hypothetical protein KIPB_014386, partial [Kipferlia bialata]|eukprot:g14386.t1
MSTTLETLVKLPKVDLHRHLDGSVRPQTILDLATEGGIQLPGFEGLPSLAAVESDYYVSDECTSLLDYLRGFDISLAVMQSVPNLVRITKEVVEDAHRDGVVYVEIRFGPQLHTRE